MAADTSYRQSLLYIGAGTLLIAIIALSYLSYSRATMTTNRIETLETIHDTDDYQISLLLEPVSNSDMAYLDFEAVVYNRTNGQPVSDVPLGVRVVRFTPGEWPFPDRGTSETLMERQMLPDQFGQLDFAHRILYEEKNAEFRLEVDLPNDETATIKLD